MKRFVATTAVALLAGSSLIIPQQSASAAGCASLQRAFQKGASNYATIKNVCSTTKSIRATVPGFPDPSCITLKRGEIDTQRTGGSLSPKATGAAVC